MTLLPGFVLYALAAGGLFFSVWRLRHRLLLLAGVLVTMVLAMGTRFFDGTFTYVPLFEHLPGWDGMRTPGRLMLWTTLLLGLLAAGAVTAFAARVREIAAERVPPWPGPWLRLATLLPLLLVLVEGLNATAAPGGAGQPAAMRTVDGPMLVLPSSQNSTRRSCSGRPPVPDDRQRWQRLHPRPARPRCASDAGLPRPGQRRLPARRSASAPWSCCATRSPAPPGSRPSTPRSTGSASPARRSATRWSTASEPARHGGRRRPPAPVTTIPAVGLELAAGSG